MLARNLDEAPEEYLELRGEASEATLQQWVVNRFPELLIDFGVMTFPGVVQSKLLNDAILQAICVIRRLKEPQFDLLIGDNPLIYVGTFKTNFLLYLPLAPTAAFFATNNEKTLQKLLELEVKLAVRAMNISSVSQAERFVYATSDCQKSFIEKYLRK